MGIFNKTTSPDCLVRTASVRGAASEAGIRSVRFEIQTCISNPAICDERCTKLRRQSRPLTQAVLTCGDTRGFRSVSIIRCVELKFPECVPGLGSDAGPFAGSVTVPGGWYLPEQVYGSASVSQTHQVTAMATDLGLVLASASVS